MHGVFCCYFVVSGVITNSGGKVIVMKMAGQMIYKGSFANGVRSLSLPNWRESFSVSGSVDLTLNKHCWKTPICIGKQALYSNQIEKINMP